MGLSRSAPLWMVISRSDELARPHAAGHELVGGPRGATGRATGRLRRVRAGGRKALTAADVGAWLFTCHPREFSELLPGLRAGGRVDAWCVRPSYRLGLVAAGQPAVLWVSGPRGAVPEPGVWMCGRMTGDVDRGGERPRAGLDLALLDAPLSRDALRADPRTARLEVLRAAQMSNPSVVAPREWAAIAEALDEIS